MKPFPELLLASKSPRRQFLLEQCGYKFQTVDIDASEDFPGTLKKSQICEYLAAYKSQHYKGKIGEKVLITADTIVCLGEEVLNKPADFEEAVKMLTKLSGNVHEVFTGVCIRNDIKNLVFSVKTTVRFHSLTSDEIAHYIRVYQPYDKAGSYGVQDWMGYMGVKEITGCFYNVMGFPTSAFYRNLQKFLQT